jgi:hypothetical protein
MHKTIGMGYIRLRKDGILELTIRSNNHIKSILTQLRPYLIAKKNQADLVLEILKRQKDIKTDKEFVEVCRLIDKFAALNDSKKRKNTSDIVEKNLFPPVET